ncbi:MAG TPA: prepilin-type N-terminal cleavage/methylation domain-containing protein [Actinomycetota bacterium]|nr:prepilin-type N-terminal cleavage/methylation domain-containing protein [Actinomycetota bacterium]
MFQRLREARENEGGFTLIELLVVIIIIAILAAIAIPVFLKQREKGWKSQAESAVKNAATAMESYGTENGGSYAGAVPDTNYFDSTASAATNKLVANGLKMAPAVNVAVLSSDTSGYCLAATHDNIPAATYTVYFGSANGAPSTSTCVVTP